MGNFALQTAENTGVFYRVRLSLCRYKLNGRKLAPSKISIASKVYSVYNEKKERLCRFSYDQIQQELNLSRGTVAEAIGTLKEVGIIEAIERDKNGTGYKFSIELASRGGYMVVPQYLCTQQFCINGETRRLKNSEIIVLAYIMKECKRERYYEGYPASVRMLARVLNLSEKTVSKAIYALLRAKLIFRPQKGVNGHQKSCIVVNSKLLYAPVKKKKAKVESVKLPKAVVDANAKAERERYYALLREKAEKRAEKYLEIARDNPQYRSIEGELNRLEFKTARAETYEPNTLPSLLARKKQLQCQRAELLRNLRINVADLEPQYVCKKCSDSGYLPNGRMCDCYPRE